MVRQKVSHICEPLYSARAAQVQLHFVAEDCAIWLDNRTQAVHSTEELQNVITLAELSSKRSSSITDQTRLIIAVILGHTLLHMWDTPWLREWNREKIVFIRSANTVPLKPYLLFKRNHTIDDEDEFNRLHPYPDILGLGIILLELHLQQSLQSYVQPKEPPNVNSPWINAQTAFNKHQINIYKNYRMAIKACLDSNFASDVDPDEDPEEFRRRIYLEIVKPLEDELEAGFSDFIDLNDLDDKVKELDVAKFGQYIPKRPIVTQAQYIPPEQHGPPHVHYYTEQHAIPPAKHKAASRSSRAHRPIGPGKYTMEEITAEEADRLERQFASRQYVDV